MGPAMMNGKMAQSFIHWQILAGGSMSWRTIQFFFPSRETPIEQNFIIWESLSSYIIVASESDAFHFLIYLWILG